MNKIDRFWSHEAQNIRCVRESDYDRDVNAWQERALIAEAKQAQQGEPHNCELEGGHLPIGWGGLVFCELCSARLPDEPELDKPEQLAAVDERAKFEAWQQKDGWKRPNDPGEWEAWQARAVLAPAAVVMPERMTTIPEGKTISYAAGYEAALDAVASLNRTVPLELLERAASHIERHTYFQFGEPVTSSDAESRALSDELRAILGDKP